MYGKLTIMKLLCLAPLVASFAIATTAHAQNTQPAYVPTPEMHLFPVASPTPAKAKPYTGIGTAPRSGFGRNSAMQTQAAVLQQAAAQQQAQQVDAAQPQAAAPNSPVNQTLKGILDPSVFQALSPAAQAALKAANPAQPDQKPTQCSSLGVFFVV